MARDGADFDPARGRRFAAALLDMVNAPSEAERFQRGVGAADTHNEFMYPAFYIPPWNGNRKCRTLTGVVPATHILSANAYELEILRLLCLFAGDEPRTERMIAATVDRLHKACFGNFCHAGECFETSAVALRFYNTVSPNDIGRVTRLCEGIERYLPQKKRHSGTYMYWWLALRELPERVAARYIPHSLAQLRAVFERAENLHCDGRILQIRGALREDFMEIYGNGAQAGM